MVMPFQRRSHRCQEDASPLSWSWGDGSTYVPPSFSPSYFLSHTVCVQLCLFLLEKSTLSHIYCPCFAPLLDVLWVLPLRPFYLSHGCHQLFSLHVISRWQIHIKNCSRSTVSRLLAHGIVVSLYHNSHLPCGCFVGQITWQLGAKQDHHWWMDTCCFLQWLT